MAEIPPVLVEAILTPREIVVIDDALQNAYGGQSDQSRVMSVLDHWACIVGPLAQQVLYLELDGVGLVSVSLSDIEILQIVSALKSALIDHALYEGQLPLDDVEIIARLLERIGSL